MPIYVLKSESYNTEMLNVKIKDISQEGEIKVVILKGKGTKLRKIPLNLKLWSVINELIKRREKNEEDYLFTSIQKKHTSPLQVSSVHRLLKRTFLKLKMDSSRSLHSFRRTTISNLLDNGHRIENVAKIAGHSNVNTTKEYLVRESKLEDNPLLSLNYKE